jgi:cysteinyl-tRNA synthetase
MHNNFLVERSGKMSKSAGEFLRLQLLVDRGYHPLAYRLMCLQAHYRSELEFSWEGLEAALVRLKRMLKVIEVQLWSQSLSGQNEVAPVSAYQPIPRSRWSEADETGVLRDFDEAISDDLNTAKCLPLLEEVLGDKYISHPLRWHLLATMDQILGLGLMMTRRPELRVRPNRASMSVEHVEASIAYRKELRAQQNYPALDRNRDELAAKGVEVMDGDPLGWDWKRGI